MDAVLVRLESPNSPIRRIDSRNRLYQDKENEDALSNKNVELFSTESLNQKLNFSIISRFIKFWKL